MLDTLIRASVESNSARGNVAQKTSGLPLYYRTMMYTCDSIMYYTNTLSGLSVQ